jgi:hypothetical protein
MECQAAGRERKREGERERERERNRSPRTLSSHVIGDTKRSPTSIR